MYGLCAPGMEEKPHVSTLAYASFILCVLQGEA